MRWAAVAVFVGVSFALAWLVALPLWVNDEDRPGYAALFQVLAAAMMFTPAIATLVVVFAMKAPKRDRLRYLGMWPLRPAKRVVWFTAAAVLAPLVLTVATVAVSALFGWLKLDLVNFSGFQALLDDQLASLGSDSMVETAAAAMPPLGVIVLLQLLMIPLGAIINSIPAFGEGVC